MPDNEPAEDRSVRGNTLQPHTVHAQNDVTVPDSQGGEISVSTLAEAIPTGGIIMWSGTITDIPNGWTLCDGTDGTPDLTNRFIVGAGGKYSSGDSGGEESVTLSEAEMPSHSHTYNETSTNNVESEPTAPDLSNSGSFESTTGETGGDEAHENRPPYYALAFIMRN